MRRAIICLVFLLFAYPVWGQSVKVQLDKAVDFSQYKTYFWVKGMPARNPLIDQMIIDAVDQQMAARGLTKVEAGGDLQVMYAAAVDLDLQLSGISFSRVTYATGAVYRPPPPMNVNKGTLVVDLKDHKTERYVWRAIAKKTLSHGPTGDAAADAKSVESVVKKSVEKMFSKYPVKK
ncbi:MAG TPA: DUF4136 domain-containing protein [Pyrinomonadaceae bacterium]|nr:DUF4136 domain-containing protein [Pyrinomonadaceae bacterium]